MVLILCRNQLIDQLIDMLCCLQVFDLLNEKTWNDSFIIRLSKHIFSMLLSS